MSAVIEQSIAGAAVSASRVPAHRILNETEAIATAHRLAQDFAAQAAERDQQRRLPHAEIERFSASGLWAITVPQAYGGIGASWQTLSEVVKIISAADPSIGQIPQNHFGILNVLAQTATESQKHAFYGAVLQGARFGNAGPERTSKNVLDIRTRITKDPASSDYFLNGTRFYSTGALYADWVPTRALDDDGKSVFVFAARTAPGLSVVDDFFFYDPATTASGTVIFDNVRIAAGHIVPL